MFFFVVVVLGGSGLFGRFLVWSVWFGFALKCDVDAERFQLLEHYRESLSQNWGSSLMPLTGTSRSHGLQHFDAFLPQGKRFNLICKKWSQNTSVVWVKRLILLWIRSSTTTHGPANLAAVHGVLSNRDDFSLYNILHLGSHTITTAPSVCLCRSSSDIWLSFWVFPSSHPQSSNQF